MSRDGYGGLIESILCQHAADGGWRERDSGDERPYSLERGVAYPAAMLGADAAAVLRIAGVAPATERGGEGDWAVDAQGHRRTIYPPLLLYSVFQAMRLAEVAPAHARACGWRARLEVELARHEWPAEAGEVIPAAAGPRVGEVAWAALAARSAASFCARPEGVEAPTAGAEIAGVVFQEIAARQLDCGALIAAGPGDHPETAWYHELVLLHALATYAVQAGDGELIEAAVRGARHVQAEMQPDHATNQPWGLTAFLLREETWPTADQVLHSAMMGGRGPGVTSILLADALYCLREGVGW